GELWQTFLQAGRLHESRGEQRESRLSTIRENLPDGDAAQELLERRPRDPFLDMIACVFEEIAVCHATGADGFTGAAAETTVNVGDGRTAERQPAILHGAHEIDAPARRIVFVAGLEVRRARGETQAAMDARQ